MRRAGLAVVGLLAAGCAYYNGLYNANRLVREAERAEREGRTGEARSLWSQAAVKAESVVSRHPKSKYRDDALLLRGRALARMGSCGQATPSLAVAADSSPDAALRVEAALLLAQCRLDLRQPDSALLALGPAFADAPPAQRSSAQLMRGQALLQLDRNEDALTELSASASPSAAFPRAVALARLGRREEAGDALRAVVGEPYDEELWLPTLDTVGQGAPGAVTGLVDRLVDAPDARLGERIRLWLADGERWLGATDTSRAEARFAQVRAAAPDSVEGRAARAYLATFQTARATDWLAIPALLDSVNVAIRQGGEPVRIGGKHASVLGRTVTGLTDDSTGLALFLSAEDIRDSLANAILAASLLGEVAGRFPESPVAPKALLALATLRPEASDSLVGVLRSRYPASPYTLVLQGQGSDAYEALEDSLARASAGMPGRPRRRQ